MKYFQTGSNIPKEATCVNKEEIYPTCCGAYEIAGGAMDVHINVNALLTDTDDSVDEE